MDLRDAKIDLDIGSGSRGQLDKDEVDTSVANGDRPITRTKGLSSSGVLGYGQSDLEEKTLELAQYR